jgi:hypothetical protein
VDITHGWVIKLTTEQVKKYVLYRYKCIISKAELDDCFIFHLRPPPYSMPLETAVPVVNAIPIATAMPVADAVPIARVTKAKEKTTQAARDATDVVKGIASRVANIPHNLPSIRVNHSASPLEEPLLKN